VTVSAHLAQLAAPAILVGYLVVVMLAVWLPVAGARRWVPARWRAFTASVGSVLVLTVGGWLTVLSFSSLVPR